MEKYQGTGLSMFQPGENGTSVCYLSPHFRTENQNFSGAHQMEPPSPLISWVNPLPSRFISRTIFFCNTLESHECACCLLFDVRQYYCHFSIFIGSFLYQRTKPPQGTVLFINLLGKGLTPRACTGDGGSIWWVPDFVCSETIFLRRLAYAHYYILAQRCHPRLSTLFPG